jgi:hypothetical protein
MGIPSYWLIDIKEPSGHEVGRLDRPFPVAFAAADLVL